MYKKTSTSIFRNALGHRRSRSFHRAEVLLFCSPCSSDRRRAATAYTAASPRNEAVKTFIDACQLKHPLPQRSFICSPNLTPQNVTFAHPFAAIVFLGVMVEYRTFKGDTSNWPDRSQAQPVRLSREHRDLPIFAIFSTFSVQPCRLRLPN